MTVRIVKLAEHAPFWRVYPDDTPTTASWRPLDTQKSVSLERSSGNAEYELLATGLTVMVAGVEKKACAKIRSLISDKLFYAESKSLILCRVQGPFEMPNSFNALFEKFGELNRQLQVQVAELCKAHGVEGQWVGTLKIERKAQESSEDVS